MILQCPIQFESGDSVQAMNLGIRDNDKIQDNVDNKNLNTLI